MTVATNDTVERYTISGVGPYAFSFRIFDDDDLTVRAVDSVTGTAALLTKTTDYTVAGVDDEDGGSVTLTAGAASTYSGDTLDIRSNTPEEQPTNLTNVGRYNPETIQQALDYLARQIQDVRRAVNASVRAPDYEAPLALTLPVLATRQGKYSAFDASGQPVASAGTGADDGLRTDLAATTVLNDGARLVGYRRNEASALARTVSARLRDELFLADYLTANDGTGDQSTAINAAVSELPTDGGYIHVPPGAYRFASTLNFGKRVRFIGATQAEAIGNNSAVRFVKASTLNGIGFNVTANACIFEGFTLEGEVGNGSDGIVLASNYITLRNVSVLRMGRDGIRVGLDGAGNCNFWHLDHVLSKSNSRYGLHVHSNTGGAPDANAGRADMVDCANNTSHGIYVRNALRNTFTALLTEGNTGDGLRVDTPALENCFVGGDFSEGNGGDDIHVVAGASRNIFIGCGVLAAEFIDNGTETIVLTPNKAFKMHSAILGAILTNGVGPAFAGNSAYMALSADGTERIRVGWQNAAVAVGLVPAQVLADTSALRLVSRDTAGAIVEIRAGSAIPVAGVFSAAGFHPGAATAASPVITSGAGSPEGVVTASVGSFYLRTNGGAGTSVYVKESGAGNTGWVGK